ncbi:hypothetical protein CDL15_Pgr000057 [Punica granatum]|uniref:Uncharacterized protein n=1 Tax=Punica granatum TaxID=22663 RepID=A0A218VQH2_PUNGR|nr:hypothetical protein CDL15_Pgr000057 [Punica granatum]
MGRHCLIQISKTLNKLYHYYREERVFLLILSFQSSGWNAYRDQIEGHVLLQGESKQRSM